MHGDVGRHDVLLPFTLEVLGYILFEPHAVNTLVTPRPRPRPRSCVDDDAAGGPGAAVAHVAGLSSKHGSEAGGRYLAVNSHDNVVRAAVIIFIFIFQTFLGME